MKIYKKMDSIVGKRAVEHCQMFLSHKKRFCRMSVKKGNEFCGEHMPADEDGSASEEKIRIVCPLDNSHTCFQSKLKKHLKVCNAKRLLDSTPNYIVHGINRGDTHLNIPERIPLIELDQSVIDAVIEKVEVAYDKLPKVEELLLKHEILESEIAKSINGNNSKKHLIQNSSLLGHICSAGLLQEDTCFIEFGAGRGKLSYWFAQSIKNLKGSSLVLVDRSSPRHKNDNKLKNDENTIDVTRIRADIADLLLEKIPPIQNSKNKVGIAKHLCGAATDLTIRCLERAMKEPINPGIFALVIAFCCHHCCEYASYVGKEFLVSAGFTVKEFPILCSLASWATCGIIKRPNTPNSQSNETVKLDQRELIGQKVKMLLNWGRLDHLKKNGFADSHLYYYIDREISLENMCIVAICQSSK